MINFIARWVFAGTALAYLAPAIKPFEQVSLHEHMSVKEFVTQDNSFKRAVAQSRLESDKLLAKAKVNAGSIITTTFSNIR